MIADSRVFIRDEIVTRSIAGDSAACDELVSACLPHIWRTVYLCCGKSPDVEDLTQTTIVRVLEKLPTYRGSGKFTAWLDQVTINVVRMHLRRRRFVAELFAQKKLGEPVWTDEVSPDRRAEGRRLLERLAAHLSTVRPKSRMALVLSILHDHSVLEIATAVGCSEEAAKKRLQRGRKELVARLESDPFFADFLKELR